MASFTSEVPGLPSNREALEIIQVVLEIIVCDIKDAGHRRKRETARMVSPECQR